MNFLGDDSRAGEDRAEVRFFAAETTATAISYDKEFCRGSGVAAEQQSKSFRLRLGNLDRVRPSRQRLLRTSKRSAQNFGK